MVKVMNEIFNEYKSIVLIKILTLIKKNENDRSKRFWVT